MSVQNRCSWVGRWVGGLLGLALGLPGACAAEPGVRPLSLEPRVVVGRGSSAEGLLLANERPGRPWATVGKGQAIYSRDLLLTLPGTRAAIQGPEQAVSLVLWSSLPAQTNAPLWETDVIVHDSRAFDLDFTLLGGRVLLTNQKKSGAARLWVRLPTEAWEITLTSPGTRVAVELYGRWPRGVPFLRGSRIGHQPTHAAELVVLEGEVVLHLEGGAHTLTAPPGPAAFNWDSIGGAAAGPQRRERVPDWASGTGGDPETEKALGEVVQMFRESTREHRPATALLAILNRAAEEKNPRRAQVMQQFSVLGLAALDEVTAVARILNESEQAGAREAAVLALRHWIGAGQGRDQWLYQTLMARLAYPPTQAETVLGLLHNPFLPEEPATYQTLIAYLHHSKRSVRQLAHWHLVRLVPQGRTIAYDPAGPVEAREKAIQAWRKLIPSGSLPPKEEK
jgi:hypothetical protein